MPTHTPWGISDTEKHIAPGITGYTTASHGGYQLSAERLAEMPPSWRSVHGYEAGWYEEDCTWSLVVLAFPEAFDAFTLTYALPCAERWCADLLEEWPKAMRERYFACLEVAQTVTAAAIREGVVR